MKNWRTRSHFQVNAMIGLLLTLLLSRTVIAADWEVRAPGRVMAFGDVHGAFSELTGLLQQAGVIDDNMAWSGGNTHLVSLGDLLDRGPDSRKVLEMLMRLQDEAAAAGGAVHVVIGNHELMVMTGDLRYVSAAEYRAFADDPVDRDRDTFFNDWYEQRFGDDCPAPGEVEDRDPPWFCNDSDHGQAVDSDKPSPPPTREAQREVFDGAHPPGFLAMTEAFSSRGRYGKWLLAQPMVLKVNDTLFLHGGLAPKISEASLVELNRDNRRTLRDYLVAREALQDASVLPVTFDFYDRGSYLAWRLQKDTVYGTDRKGRPDPRKPQLPDWADSAARLSALAEAPVFANESPQWYRGSIMCHAYVGAYDVETALQSWRAERAVVGHTPSRDARVRSHMEGLLYQTDTGMLQAIYKGRPSLLVIDGNKVSAMYAGEDGLQQINEIQRRVASQTVDDEAMERFLRTARIIENKEIGTGVTKPRRLKLTDGKLTSYAVYKNFDSDPRLEQGKRFNKTKGNNSDRYVYDVAAYRIDRLLDLHMVPVPVIREVDGKRGLVQAWINDTINERDRVEENVPFTGYCGQWQQYRLRILFDILLYNEDRNLTNILWTRKDFQLWFIDHSIAFRSHNRRPKQYAKVDLQLSDLFRRKLVALDRATLDREIGAYLHPVQIEALLARRDLILKESKSTRGR